MGIQINNSQDIYRKTEMSQKRNNGHYQTVLDGIKSSSNHSDSAKVKKGLSTYDAYALMKNLNSKFSANNLTTDSGKSAQKVDAKRYSMMIACNGLSYMDNAETSKSMLFFTSSSNLKFTLTICAIINTPFMFYYMPR